MHNLKTKTLSITLTAWAMFVPISAFLLFLVSEVVCGEECVYIWPILQILPQLKKLFPKI